MIYDFQLKSSLLLFLTNENLYLKWAPNLLLSLHQTNEDLRFNQKSVGLSLVWVLIKLETLMLPIFDFIWELNPKSHHICLIKEAIKVDPSRHAVFFCSQKDVFMCNKISIRFQVTKHLLVPILNMSNLGFITKIRQYLCLHM